MDVCKRSFRRAVVANAEFRKQAFPSTCQVIVERGGMVDGHRIPNRRAP